MSQVGNTSFTFLAFNGQVSGRLPVMISVQEPSLDGETSLSGVLLDTTNAVGGGNQAIVSAVVSLVDTGVSAVTATNGRFVLNRIPGGLQVLDIAVASAQPSPDGIAIRRLSRSDHNR